ncbi:hypothetical protein KBC51_01615 [Candidatus Saccharibacteria bacterium]|mgnify:FL=1|nr:hypothetical protein [Candidatus Saccharibacteria bacterium]
MKNEIEINGRKYDAVTGKLLNGPTVHSPTHQNQKVVSNGRNLDGVRKSASQPTIGSHAHMSPVPKQAQSTVNKKVIEPSRQVVDGLRKKPQKSVTLARKVVKKPTTRQALVHSKSIAPVTKSQSEQNMTPNPTQKSFFKKVPEARLARALSQKTSSAISRFTPTSPASKAVVSPELAVQPQPNHQIQTTTQPKQLSNSSKTVKHSVIKQHTANQKNNVFDHKPVAQLNQHDSPDVRPFHKKVHHRVRNRRYLSGLVAACFAFLLLFSFLAYQKIPQVAVKVAAHNAGFDARVPSNIPSGYSFKSPVKKTDDSLAISYKSNTDERQFKIIQKESSWTSESLLSNFLIDGKKQYQAYYDKGMTVFVYDNSNATWVDKGVWFTLETNGALSSEQILSLASSI